MDSTAHDRSRITLAEDFVFDMKDHTIKIKHSLGLFVF